MKMTHSQTDGTNYLSCLCKRERRRERGKKEERGREREGEKRGEGGREKRERVMQRCRFDSD
jgi:hypothetical protein